MSTNDSHNDSGNAAAAQGEPEVSPTELLAPVAEVTLLEDRAHVVRRGRVSLDAGTVVVRIEGVAPVLSDKTLSVAVLDPSPRVKVIDARILREEKIETVGIADAAAPDSRALDRDALLAQLNRIDVELEELNGRRLRLQEHAGGFDEIASLTFSELAQDASWGRTVGSEWSQKLEQLRTDERGMRQRLLELDVESEEKAKTRELVQLRIEALETAASRANAVVDVELAVEAAGEHQLQIDYVVPGACWRPYHQARLIQGESTQVTFRTDACVWQNTGEDWNEAALVFSTERPSLGTEPPQLASDVLDVKKRSEAVEVETREQEIQTTGLGQETAAASPELPGIDDGGQAVTLRAEGPSTVPSDGRPYRVRLQSFDSVAAVELVSIPELAPSVLLKSVQVNQGAGPVLAGPVDLVRDSGLVGRTSVLFIAPGEKFPLGWGPEPELRVRREVVIAGDESRMLSSWTSRKHGIKVLLSNIGATERTVTISERVPVSEIDKVKVELGAQSTVTPDDDGFVKWTVALAPFGRDSVELRYTLKKHDDVVGI